MKGKMKVQNFYGPLDMKPEEHEIPKIADNEVLIRIRAVGICGSDISYYYGHSPLGTADGKGPMYLGHEASGVVAEVGSIPSSMGLFREGDRVAINPVQQCNACPACMRGEFNMCSNVETIGVSVNGCFAEYVKVKYTHVYKIPDEISFAHAALAEPLACALHGVRMMEIALGQTAVVYGVGGIGLMQLQAVKASGAGCTIAVGVRDFGLGIAKKLGADHLINMRDKQSPYYAADVPEKVQEFTGGKKAERAIVATSNMQALQNAIEATGPCSTTVFFGLPSPQDKLEVPVMEAIQSERTLKFSWLAPLVWDHVFMAVASGQINLEPIITHRFSLEQAEEGIRFMKESKEDKIKGILVLDS